MAVAMPGWSFPFGQRQPTPVDSSMNQNPYMGFMDVSAGVQPVNFDPTKPITPDSNAPTSPLPNFGGDTGIGVDVKPPQAAPENVEVGTEGDYPSEASIARRQKLAEALLGKQMEVNHPLQAVANAVSQITGAYLQKKAETDQEKLQKHRMDQYRQMFGEGDPSKMDMAAIARQLMQSDNPDDVQKGIELMMRLASKGGANDKPIIRTFWRPDGTAWQGQWVPDENEPTGGRWEMVGEGPRSTKGGPRGRTPSGGDQFDPTDDPDSVGGSAPDAPAGVPSSSGAPPTGLPPGSKIILENGQPVIVDKDGKKTPTSWPSERKYRGKKGTMADGAVTIAAFRLLNGDRNWSIGISRANGGIQNQQVQERAYEIGVAMGLNPEQIAARIGASGIEYEGSRQRTRTASRLAATSTIFVEAARSFSDVVKAKSQLVQRGPFLPWNRVQQAIARNTGDPNIVAFYAAVNSFVQAYAKAVTPTGQPTEGQRQHAYDMLSTAMTEDQFDAVMETLDEEMVNEQRRIDETAKRGAKDWEKEHGGTPREPASPDASTSPSGRMPSDTHGPAPGGRGSKPSAPVLPSKDKLEKGKVYDTPRGKMRWTGTGFVPA